MLDVIVCCSPHVKYEQLVIVNLHKICIVLIHNEIEHVMFFVLLTNPACHSIVAILLQETISTLCS